MHQIMQQPGVRVVRIDGPHDALLAPRMRIIQMPSRLTKSVAVKGVSLLMRTLV
jgi:hypothetical protein